MKLPHKKQLAEKFNRLLEMQETQEISLVNERSEELHWDKMEKSEREELVSMAGLPKFVAKDDWDDLDRRAKAALGKTVSKTTQKEFSLVESKDGKILNTFKESVEHLDEALTLASDNLNLVKKTAEKLAKQSPDLTYYVVKHNERYMKGMKYAYYEVYQSVDMHLVRGKAKKVAGYGAKVDMRESVELGEATATRTAVDKEFAKVTRSGKMDTMAAIKYLEKKFKITGIQIEKDKNGKAHVISFQESVNELDEAKESDPRIGKLSQDSKNALLSFVNVLGTAGGVWMDAQNLDYLMPKAVDDTIKKGEKALGTMSSGGKKAFARLKKELSKMNEVSEAKKYEPSKILKPGRKGGMPTGFDRGDDTKPLLVWLDDLEKELKKKRKSYDDVNPDDALILYYKDTDPKKAAKDLLSGKKIKESISEAGNLQGDVTVFEFSIVQDATDYSTALHKANIKHRKFGLKIKVSDEKIGEAMSLAKKYKGRPSFDEDAPANSTGSGVSGMDSNTVGVNPKDAGKSGDIQKRESVDEGIESTIRSYKTQRHKKLIDSIDGCPVFKVSSGEYAKFAGTSGRKRFSKWLESFREDSPGGSAIKKYSLRNPRKPVVIQDDQSGEIMYLRRKNSDRRLKHNKRIDK